MKLFAKNKAHKYLSGSVLAAIAFVLAGFAVHVPQAEAAYSKPDGNGQTTIGGGFASLRGQLTELMNQKTMIDKFNQMTNLLEESQGTEAARKALTDENDDKRAMYTAIENSRRIYETASYQNALLNQKPSTQALGMSITRLGLANLLTVGPSVSQRLIQTMVQDDGASNKAIKGTLEYAKNWATLACSSGGISSGLAQSFSSAGVSCSTDQRLSGTAMSPSAWLAIDSIKGKPGEKDMDAFKAMVLLGCTDAGNMPRGARLTEPGGFQRAIAEAKNGLTCREYAACLGTKLRKKFGFDTATIGADYTTQKAVLQKEGQKCGADGFFSQECLHRARYTGRKQNAQDSVREANMPGRDAMGYVAQLDAANSTEAQGSDTEAASCMTDQVQKNVQANLEYFNSQEFMLALQDGSFARDVNYMIAQLPQEHKKWQVAFNNSVREFMYGVQINMYAENDPRIQKKPEQMALSDVFEKAGVDMANMMPITGQKLPMYASLLPSLMDQARDVSGLLMLADGNRGVDVKAENQLVSFTRQAMDNANPATLAAH